MERQEDALVRECKEEFGIDIKVLRLLKVIDHIIQKDKQHWVNPIFLAGLAGGEPKILEPHKFSEIGWFSFSDHPKPLAVNLEDLFADIKSGKIRID
jgi:ADP-ribose pyrophosphatase YjhB (NUDIX family)